MGITRQEGLEALDIGRVGGEEVVQDELQITGVVVDRVMQPVGVDGETMVLKDQPGAAGSDS